MTRPIYVEIHIDAPLAEVWRLTQDPTEHSRWDLRFGSIEPTGPGTFRYATRVLPFLTVAGTGVHAGERHRPDGGCTSALRFSSPHPLSLIAEGSGYWRYLPERDGTGVRFVTGYDYRPRWGPLGRVVDTVLFRPLIGWATAWSFDRLRIWLEHGVPPERSRLRALLGPSPTSPSARRTRRCPDPTDRAVRAPRIAATLDLQETR